MKMGHDFQIGQEPAALAAESAPVHALDAWPFTPEPGAAVPAPDGAAPDELPHPEWFALRSRFAALHALRATLEQNPECDPTGGFVDSGRAVLRSCRTTERAGTSGVNLFYSANGKTDHTIMTAVAATPTPGDRGSQ